MRRLVLTFSGSSSSLFQFSQPLTAYKLLAVKDCLMNTDAKILKHIHANELSESFQPDVTSGKSPFKQGTTLFSQSELDVSDSMKSFGEHLNLQGKFSQTGLTEWLLNR